MRKSSSFFALFRASLLVTLAGILLAATVWYFFRRLKL
jgi:hypothetical protein